MRSILTTQARFKCGDRVRHRVHGAGTVVGVQDDTRDPWYSEQPWEYLPDVHVYLRFQDDGGTWKGNRWRGAFLLPQGAFTKIETGD